MKDLYVIYLASNIKSEYTYDSLSRVTNRKLTNLTDNTVTEENYSYDANGNILSVSVSAQENTFVYDDSNRLIEYNGQAVTYDMDGNMVSATLNNSQMSFIYDSTNRLILAGENSYIYNVEDVRAYNFCGESQTTYTYNTNGRLSQLLVKTTDGVVTKYVYGLGLIGEETNGSFKTYHFDYRGSTTAITDINGNVTDTFAYDAYGNLTSRTGQTEVIFLYNGNYGVITDDNGLLYMRARYYSPELRRFINADIIAGEISNSATLNRYAYANGNPVSNVDPFGLSAEHGNHSNSKDSEYINEIVNELNISYEHARIIYYSNQWEGHAEVKWTTWDIINWKTFGGSDFLFSKKESFVSNYKDVIIDAANKYDIPVFLLAGVVYTEFGGDPMWIDDIAYAVRAFDWCGPDWVDKYLTITNNPNYTSFGNTSIQIRRALEMLGYSDSSNQTSNVISMLKDPIKNIYMAARHLDVLRNVDFSGLSANELNDEAIQIIASRYNIGPDRTIEDAKNASYGKSIFNNKDSILKALGLC